MKFINNKFRFTPGEKGISLLLILFALAILILGIRNPTVFGAPWEGYWDASYQFTEKESVTLSWDRTDFQCPTGETCGYQAELRLLEDNEAVVNSCVANGLDTLQCTFHYKESGHWKGYLRVWHSTDMTQFQYSDWGNSFNQGAMLIDGVLTRRGWVLYWRIPPASNGEIN